MRALPRLYGLAGALLALLAIAPGLPLRAQAPHAHHSLRVTLDPATRRLDVSDTLALGSADRARRGGRARASSVR